MPPTRQELALSGRILGYEEHTGAELDMKPADMTIYVYRFRVERAGDSQIESGQEIELRSKLAPPEDWRGRSFEVRVAAYARRDYWLVGL